MQTPAVALGPEAGRKEVPPSDLVENWKFGDGFLSAREKKTMLGFAIQVEETEKRQRAKRNYL